MTSSSSPPAQYSTEPPECPVCLQPYDDTATIPRVLPCGHSVCDTCLTHLHKLSLSPPHTLRCPACTQLVKFLGPTSLPKNIDLLHLSLPQTQKPPQSQNPPEVRRRFGFPLELFSDELYATWKHWVLPQGAVVFDGVDRDQQEAVLVRIGGIGIGRIAKSSNSSELRLNGIMQCRLVEDQKVGLLEVGRFKLDDSLLEYSYVSKVMNVLKCMCDAQRTELFSILGVSLRSSRVCRVLGLWLDVENGCLYLVSERMDDGLLSLENLDAENEDWVAHVRVIGFELCEILIGLRREGFVCGCMGLSCFRFDEFGHVYVDLSEVLVKGRKIREHIAKGVKDRTKTEMDGSDGEVFFVDVSKMDVFISPEVLSELIFKEGTEKEKNDLSFTVCYGSDVWLLSCVLLRFLIGQEFVEEMCSNLTCVFEPRSEEISGCKVTYLQWIEKVNLRLETLMGCGMASLKEILLKCLDFDPGRRPLITDVWKSVIRMNSYHYVSHIGSLNGAYIEEDVGHCLIHGVYCSTLNSLWNDSSISNSDKEHDDGEVNLSQDADVGIDEVVKRLSAGKVHCKELQGHLDCITGLCVGGFHTCSYI